MDKEEVNNLLKWLKEDKYKQEIKLKRSQYEITDVSNRIKQVKSRIEEEQTGTVSSKIQYLLSNGSLNGYIQEIDSKKLDELDIQLAELTIQKEELINDAKYANKRINDYEINKKLILEQYEFIRFDLANSNSYNIKDSKHNPNNKISMLIVHYQYYEFSNAGELIKQNKGMFLYIPPDNDRESKWIIYDTDKLISENTFAYQQIQAMINNIKDENKKRIFV